MDNDDRLAIEVLSFLARTRTRLVDFATRLRAYTSQLDVNYDVAVRQRAHNGLRIEIFVELMTTDERQLFWWLEIVPNDVDFVWETKWDVAWILGETIISKQAARHETFRDAARQTAAIIGEWFDRLDEVMDRIT